MAERLVGEHPGARPIELHGPGVDFPVGCNMERIDCDAGRVDESIAAANVDVPATRVNLDAQRGTGQAGLWTALEALEPALILDAPIRPVLGGVVRIEDVGV